MKNKSVDLHNHLFAELERLGDESLKGENLAEEINRAGAICKVAGHIIANEHLVVKAYEVIEGSMGNLDLPLILDGAVSVKDRAQNHANIRKIGVYGEHLSKGKAANE
jgi:hypothetical protein